MSLEQFAHILNIIAWLSLSIMCFPGLIRLLRGHVSPLDPLKSALFLVSLAQLNTIIARSFYSHSLWTWEDVPFWTFSVLVLFLTITTLLIVLRKTDKAMSPPKNL